MQRSLFEFLVLNLSTVEIAECYHIALSHGFVMRNPTEYCLADLIKKSPEVVEFLIPVSPMMIKSVNPTPKMMRLHNLKWEV